MDIRYTWTIQFYIVNCFTKQIAFSNIYRLNFFEWFFFSKISFKCNEINLESKFTEIVGNAGTTSSSSRVERRQPTERSRISSKNNFNWYILTRWLSLTPHWKYGAGVKTARKTDLWLCHFVIRTIIYKLVHNSYHTIKWCTICLNILQSWWYTFWNVSILSKERWKFSMSMTSLQKHLLFTPWFFSFQMN